MRSVLAAGLMVIACIGVGARGRPSSPQYSVAYASFGPVAELYTIRPDGRDLKRLTHSPGNDAHASWSFDGEWIAFASARGGFKDEMPVGEGGGQGAGDVFVMRSDGSDVRRLTDDAFEEATPAFAPSLAVPRGVR